MPSPHPQALRLCLLALVVSASTARAQPAQLYPGLSGEPLLEALATGFAPSFTFSYDRGRDSLFAAVYAEHTPGPRGDSLRCVYSGRAVYLDPALDPTTTAYAASPRISTEHLWPQNRGALVGTPLHSDLHHLAPVQQTINASRGDSPFGEVPDAEASRWWGPDGTTRTAEPPLSSRDLYSEKRNGSVSLMEPRESVEGDVARALFYVWTVYGPHGGPSTTTTLDAGFFAEMLPTLLAWSASDPPDDAERRRSVTVARWQGTQNPFVVDASLADRAFAMPTTVSGATPLARALTLSPPSPNPSSGTVRLTLTLAQPSQVRAVVVDALGRTVAVALDELAAGAVEIAVEASHLAPGVYALRASTPGGGAAERFVVVR